MKQRLSLLILSVLLGATWALASTDTLTINHYRQFPTVSYDLPFMSDSVDLNGATYDPFGQLSHFSLPSHQDAKVVPTDADGFIHLNGGEREVHLLYASLLSPKFEKAKLIVESTLPYYLQIDGNELVRNTSPDGSPWEVDLTLYPSYHHPIYVRSVGEGQIRLRLVPALDRSEIELRHDQREYVNLEYMLSGESIHDVSVSPSGRYTLLLRQEIVGEDRRYSAILYDGEKPITVLQGDLLQYDWMPKSDKLWGTRDGRDGKELITYDPSNAQYEVLHHSIPEGSFMISPNESQLIYWTKVEGPKKSESLVRVLDRYDGLGGYRDRFFLASFDLQTGKYQPLTFGYRGTSMQSISNDGKEVIFSTSRNTTEIPFSESDYMTLDLTSMQVDTLWQGNRDISRVYHTARPDYLVVSGSANAFDGIGKLLPADQEINTYDTQLFLYQRSTGRAFPLTKELDRTVNQIEVVPNAFEVYFLAEDHDRLHLYHCDLSTRKVTPMETCEEVLNVFDVSNDGKKIAYKGQSTLNADRFYMRRGLKGRESLIYDLATKKMECLMLGEAHDWDFTMPNGDVVQGRYYLPPNFDPNKKYPMIVYYYGGTAPTQRYFEGSYSLPMYAAQGYVVYTLNPSGTTGFGQEYAARHINAWGKRTADEIIASVKGFCQEHSFVNAEKIGCMGASYGGFMTMYLQTVSDIFATAVSHAGISNIASYWGEGTWGIGYSTVASLGSYPWNNPSLYVEQSPLFHADKISTPLLLLHGDQDNNVPEGESTQMYNALKILGKEVELVRVLGENHGIVEPSKKREWTNTIFAWFQKYLMDDDTFWNSLYPKVHL